MSRFRPERFPRLVVPAAAALVLLVSITFGGRAAVGADAFGYVSQSVLWMRGDLRIHQPFVSMLPWPDADATFTPLGYLSKPDHVLVPTYAPGLPLLMAGAGFLSACAPDYIVPVCAALLVVVTAAIGRRVFGGAANAIAGAVMVAASPAVLSSAVAPMTDIPVATFWMAALFAADRPTRKGAAVAGALSGLAILIRPNLAPLAVCPLMLSAVHGGDRRAILARLITLTAAVTPFGFFVAILHDRLYGSPFTSGYGSASMIYSLRNVPPNLLAYPAWWWYAHGIVGWFFLAGLFQPRPSDRRRRAMVLILFAVLVALCYLFYMPFDYWGYLRFVLPAVPIVMLLSADGVAWLSSHLGAAGSKYGLVLVTALAVVHGVSRSRGEGFFRNAQADRRYVDAALFIDSVTPPATVVLSMQHSGSVRFYSGRLTLRYDQLDPMWLDRALDRLAALGFSSYALLEEWEESRFRERFSTQQSTRLLDGRPLAARETPGGHLRLFALRRAASATDVISDPMPRTSRFDCTAPSARFAAIVQMPAVR